MGVGSFRAKSPLAVALMILLWTAMIAACGGEEATPAESPAEQHASTVLPITVPSTPIQSSATASQSIPTPDATSLTLLNPTVIPTIAVTPPTSPPATTLPIVPSTPTTAPEPAATPGPSPVPQTAELQLEVTFPPEDMVVDTDNITVTGIASPDATVSVNGRLAIPNAEGRFSLELTFPPEHNPLPIEVIATSVAGEQLSLVRTVIFIP